MTLNKHSITFNDHNMTLNDHNMIFNDTDAQLHMTYYGFVFVIINILSYNRYLVGDTFVSKSLGHAWVKG